MLYLPSIDFQDHEIRLPSPANDVVRLCASCTDLEMLQHDVQEILVANPSLLICALNSFWSENGRQPAVSCKQLCDWMAISFFRSDIESDAFSTANQLRATQQSRLLKWNEKPTRKRLVKFLASVTELDVTVIRRFVAQIHHRDFVILRPVKMEVAKPETVLLKWNQGNSKQLPVRKIWLVSARLQKLQQSFETELQRKKLIAMKQLAYGASHEINNPLANIATRAQSLMSDEANPTRRQRMSVIYAQAMRAHEMISDMMLFAQPPELSFESAAPTELIRQIVDEMHNEFSENEITVRVRQYPDVPRCELDLTQISVAIKALLTNAVHSIGANGLIRIQVWRRGPNQLGFAIADDGRGVDPAIADQIFDPFFSGREAGRGLGFGLSKVWRIVEMHGGETELDTNQQSGARFVITLPINQNKPGKLSSSRIDKICAA